MQGAQVGNYRITGVIGEGGMGKVYAAQHALLGRPAAIKVLLPEFSRNQDIVHRFFNEARAATAIRHPGIVEIYDFGYVEDGSAYIAMEYLEGQPLQSRLKQRRALPANEALWLARQIAGALGAAHALGIVHRDLKPDNVFLVRDPEVPTGERIKLLDFGIAKLAGDGNQMSQRTRTGAVMGTPTYMAPEQCRGVGVDHRADIYSLGCMVFEMLCGRPPFVGEGVGDILAAHIHVPAPALRTIAPDTMPEVEALVAHLLAKDPAQRPQNAEQVIASIDALGSVLGRPRVSALVSSPTVAMPTGGSRPSIGSAPSLPPQQTTLGGAAGTFAAPTAVGAPKSRTGLMIGLTGVALAAGIVIAVVVNKGGGSTESKAADTSAAKTTKDPEPAPKPDPEPEPTPPKPDPQPPAPQIRNVTMTIASTPKGAAVISDGVELGKTPLSLERPSADGTLHLTVRLDGYADLAMDVPANANVDRAVVLQEIEQPSTKTTKTSKKTTKTKKTKKSGGDSNSGDRNDSVNPFD